MWVNDHNLEVCAQYYQSFVKDYNVCNIAFMKLSFPTQLENFY